jgi:hypothetical protein
MNSTNTNEQATQIKSTIDGKRVVSPKSTTSSERPILPVRPSLRQALETIKNRHMSKLETRREWNQRQELPEFVKAAKKLTESNPS